jgi:Protein of unknown function (DUF732)
MAGELASGRPMARHAATDGGMSGVPGEGRESVMTEDRPYMGDLLRTPPASMDALDELARRRASAEQAAMVAEIDAAAAAARAAAAIAAAARAAEEAEAAADAAGRAADEATAAAAAEERTSAALHAGIRRGVPAGAGQAAWVLAGGPAEGPQSWTVMPGAAPGMAGPPPGRPMPPGPASSWPSMFPVGHPERAQWDVPPDETPTVEGATAGRRAARRHAAEAAEAETTVFPVDDSEYDAEYAEDLDVDEFDDEPESDEVAVEDQRVRRLDRKHAEQQPRRFGRRPVLVVVGVGAVLAIVALLAALVTAEPDRPPAEVGSPLPTVAPQAPAVQVPPPAPGPESGPVEVDPTSDSAVTFLRALRAAEIPTSRSGRAEIETAAVICEELGQGVAPDKIARTVPAALPSVPRRQAAEVVDLAKDLYC